MQGRFRRWLSTGPHDEEHAAESVLIIGLGRFGTAVGRTLAELGVEVVAVDREQSLVDVWAERLPHVRRADATSATALKQLGATDFDAAVVAIGSDLEASILATAALVDLGVSNVWAKAVSDEHGRILDRIGAHHVVYPEREMGERVGHMVQGQVLDYFEIDDGFVLAELSVPKPLAGVPLGDSDIRQRFAVTVVCIKPVGQPFTYATAETVLGAQDAIVVAGTVSDVDRFAEFASP